MEEGQPPCLRAVGVDAPDLALQAVGDGLSAGPAIAVAAPPSNGVGHTRWATHRSVRDAEGHPNDEVAPTIRVARERVLASGLIANLGRGDL